MFQMPFNQIDTRISFEKKKLMVKESENKKIILRFKKDEADRLKNFLK